MQNRQFVYLDTETTGLTSTDEVLEIAIVDDQGAALVDSLCRPVVRKKWPGAQAIHGISPGDVQHSPTLADLADQIREVVRDKIVVIYNAQYDMRYVAQYLNTAVEVQCCMLKFAEYRKHWNSYYGNWRWHRLESAAHFCGHVWTGVQHRARADAEACGTVWRFLHDDEAKKRVEDELSALAEANFKL